METFIILFVFVVCPLALVAFILTGAIHRTRQHKHISDAAEKYLKS